MVRVPSPAFLLPRNPLKSGQKQLEAFFVGEYMGLEEVKKYRPNISGRPRKSIPEWRISPEDNQLLSTLILVQLRAGQQEAFMRTLEKIKQGRQHAFPGTVARYIMGSATIPEQVQILPVWRSTVMPDEAAREQALEAFRQSLAAAVDWSTAQYHSGKVFMHT